LRVVFACGQLKEWPKHKGAKIMTSWRKLNIAVTADDCDGNIVMFWWVFEGTRGVATSS